METTEITITGTVAPADQTEAVCDLLMEALLGHGRAIDPLVSATVTSGEIQVTVQVETT